LSLAGKYEESWDELLTEVEFDLNISNNASTGTSLAYNGVNPFILCIIFFISAAFSEPDWSVSVDSIPPSSAKDIQLPRHLRNGAPPKNLTSTHAKSS
jgi:hypothetical protein